MYNNRNNSRFGNNRNNTNRNSNSNRGQRFNNVPSQQSTAALVNAIRASQKNKQLQSVEAPKEYVPQNTFNDFEISNFLKKNILAKRYITPTPIQDQTIPHILQGKDIIGIANTGTGKTAAFLIPLINKVINDRNERVLIVAPTRELALQINEEFHDFAKALGIHSALCIGGTSMYNQRNELRKSSNFVIGTPGRIKDLIYTKNLSISGFKSVVLDEADRMVDIGFIEDIKYFINLLPKERQSLFFSATISNKVKEILQMFVTDPVTVSVKQQDTAVNIDQDIIEVKTKEGKIEQLHDLLIQKEFNKVLIFGRTKWGIQKLTNELVARGFKAGAIHGNKSQNQRQKTLDDFKRNAIRILLATDVASRGLDIEDVSHVINYDIPASYEDYVHRIGRTGRANNKGIALTFID